MLEMTHSKLLEEVNASERLRDESTRVTWEMVERYHGPTYIGSQQLDAQRVSLDNHYYEMVSLMVPQLVFDNPRWMVDTVQPGLQREVSVAMRHYLNRWCADTAFSALLSKACTDFMFFDPVVLVQRESVVGTSTEEFEDEAGVVTAVRLSPKRYVEDLGAISRETQRFRGHLWVTTKDDLLKLADADDSWDRSLIEEMSTSRPASEKPVKGIPEREDDLYLYDVWYPYVELEGSPGPSKGFHGTIYTLCSGGARDEKNEDRWVRKPRSWYGPRSGPYVVGETYYVPDKVRSLSVLPATEVQNRDLNVQSMALARGAAQYKRLLMLFTKDPNFANTIKNAPHDTIASSNTGKPEDVAVMEFGGVSQTQLAYQAVARERLDRASGITEAMRGNVTGVGSATENALASDAAGARQGYLRKQFTQFVQRIGASVAWYGYYDSSVVLPLGEEAGAELGMSNPVFVGGFDKEGGRFEDMEFEIEPFSMERLSPAVRQRHALQAVEFASKVVPMMASAPWFAWKDFSQWWGEQNGIPAMGEFVDTQVLQKAGVEAERKATPEPRLIRRQNGAGEQASRSGPSGPKKAASGGGVKQEAKSVGASSGNEARGY